MGKKRILITPDEFVVDQYGEIGTVKRDKFEKGYEAFIIEFFGDIYGWE